MARTTQPIKETFQLISGLFGRGSLTVSQVASVKFMAKKGEPTKGPNHRQQLIQKWAVQLLFDFCVSKLFWTGRQTAGHLQNTKGKGENQIKNSGGYEKRKWNANNTYQWEAGTVNWDLRTMTLTPVPGCLVSIFHLLAQSICLFTFCWPRRENIYNFCGPESLSLAFTLHCSFASRVLGADVRCEMWLWWHRSSQISFNENIKFCLDNPHSPFYTCICLLGIFFGAPTWAVTKFEFW